MRVRVSIGTDGAVTLPPREAEALGVAQGDAVDLLALRGSFALLSPSRVEGGWFAGSLGAISLAEVLRLVSSTLRSGMLLLSYGEAPAREVDPDRLRRKAIALRDGQVVFASSSDPADRLGPVLWRRGRLAEEDLARASRLVGAGRPLGQVLVDLGLLTPAQVVEGLVEQVRAIVLGCFAEAEGTFVFRAGPHDERNAVQLPEGIADLVAAGVARAEELATLRARALPDAGAPLLRSGADAPTDLDFRAARLLALADGRPLRAAMAAAALDAYEGACAASELLRRGLVAPLAGGRP